MTCVLSCIENSKGLIFSQTLSDILPEPEKSNNDTAPIGTTNNIIKLIRSALLNIFKNVLSIMAHIGSYENILIDRL